MGSEEGLVPTSYTEALGPASSSTTDGERPGSAYSASSASLASSIAGSISANSKKKGPVVAPRRGAKKITYVEALYDYTARSDAEHSMLEGERLVVVNRDTGDGWADVEKGGLVRSVPASYVQDV